MVKKLILRMIALVAAMLLLTGCADMERLRNYLIEDYIAYSDMEYSRPDMQQLDEALEAAIEASKGTNLDKVVEKIYDYYDLYDSFYTNYALADIRYSGDLTDLYWVDEYNYCMDRTAAVDAGLEDLYYALAKSPCREQLESEEYFGAGYFDSYEGENAWDETFTAMLEQESSLQTQYYALSEKALAYEYGTDEY